MSEIDKPETENPTTPPVEPITPENEIVPPSVPEEPRPQVETPSSEEEAAWTSLSGSTQDRIRQLIKERKEAMDQLTRQAELDNRTTIETPAPQSTQENTEQIREAVKKLREVGNVATLDDIQSLVTRLETDRIHDTLEKEYSGEGGKPKYVREEVEDYARRRNIWDLRAAYRDMYFDELTDASRAQGKRTVYTEKPTATATREQPLTMASFREKLAGPGGREYYEKLRASGELDKVLSDLAE